MNKEPKVSIVIPCYNVEKYVERCVQSAINQSEASVEVIAIDDGSIDSTPEILDRIAIGNKKLKVIHQSNAGVSCARNTGVLHSAGKYIVFIDGDDFISSDAIEYYVGLVENNDADMGLSLDCYTRKGELQNTFQKTIVMTPAEATILLLSHRVIVGCWNKIFKRSFLIQNEIKFDENLFYGEGLRFITKASQVANKVIIGNKKVYYYRKDNASSATTHFNVKSMLNGEKSLSLIKSDLAIQDSSIDKMLDWHICNFRMGIVIRLALSQEKEENIEYYKKSLSYVRTNCLKILANKNISLYDKSIILGCAISPSLMAMMDKIRRKKNCQKSVE